MFDRLCADLSEAVALSAACKIEFDWLDGVSNRRWDAFTVPVFQRLDHTSFS
jgi:hypothetical protein